MTQPPTDFRADIKGRRRTEARQEPVQAFRAAIYAALGHAPEVIEPGRMHRFATSERRADDSGWCKLFNDLRGGVFGCYRQGVSEAWRAGDRESITREGRAELARQLRESAAKRDVQQREQWAKNARRIDQMWAQCAPLSQGDPVTLYLERRGFRGVWPLPEALRLHRGMPYWDGTEMLGTFPAMVATIIAPDGRMVALHRTYLTPDGRKAGVPSPKKLTGAAGPLVGCCIPLNKPIRACVGIAEGIETALAAWCASTVPTVASYCASNLAAWRWPVGIERLVIFADADPVGRDAAEVLRARAVAARLRCDVLTPTTDGADWCDVWATGGAVLIDGEGEA